MNAYRQAPAQPANRVGQVVAGDLVDVVAPKPGNLWRLGKRYLVERVVGDALVVDGEKILWLEEVAKTSPAARPVFAIGQTVERRYPGAGGTVEGVRGGYREQYLYSVRTARGVLLHVYESDLRSAS